MTAAEVVRDPYTWGWIAWVLAFFALEVPAVRDRRPGGTLSELVWELCSIREKHVGWRWRRIGLLCLLGWLTVHLLTGGWV
jgi:hypothetical protein